MAVHMGAGVQGTPGNRHGVGFVRYQTDSRPAHARKHWRAPLHPGRLLASVRTLADNHDAGRFSHPADALSAAAISCGQKRGFCTEGYTDIDDWHGVLVQWRPYDDPGIKWVSYFDGGSALHYFPRAGYGWPQSAGCVEMPDKAAHQVFSAIHYDTVVTVGTRLRRAEHFPDSTKGK